MMGLYIKGMDMPIKKNGAVLIIYPDGKCAFEDGKTYQAASVPPHGDLIDRREADRYALPRTEMVDGEIVQNKYVYLQTIQQLPTIIPAEEGE